MQTKMKRKKFLAFSVLFGIGASIGVFVLTSQKQDTPMFLSNIEALSASESSSWEGLKLKKVNCECPNGKSGFTAKCRTDGDKEACSATQQGLSGCYKVSIKDKDMVLLCENATIK